MKLAVLHHSLTGFWNICLKSLHSQGDVRLFVAHHRIDPNTPFDSGMFSWIDERYEWDTVPDADHLLMRVRSFRPDLLLILGWHVAAYSRVGRDMKGRCERLLYFDNCWRGTPKQWLGVITSPMHVRPIADRALVPGELQRQFARRLGFRELQIIEGALSGDSQLFESVRARREALPEKPKAFLFVGRLVKEKGLSILAQAYKRYRAMCDNPWPLICVGSGPLAHEISSVSGVEMAGFLQPEQLVEKMVDAAVFVLPSLFEPWGVPVNEAASAGMPIIVSEAVGSHVHLVQSGFNGYVVDPGSVDSLAQAMLCFHRMDDESLARMGKASEQLSEQYTPERWAETLRRIASDRNR